MSDHDKGGKAPSTGEGTNAVVQWAEPGLLTV